MDNNFIINLVVSSAIALTGAASTWLVIPYRVKRVEVEVEEVIRKVDEIPYRVKRVELDVEEVKRKSDERSDRLIRFEATMDQIRTDVTTILKKLNK